jgi:hypothetical protein
MEPEDSLPHSQVPAPCLFPEPAQSSPYLNIPLPEDPPYYLPIYAWVFPVVNFPQVSPTKPCTRISPPHPSYMPRPFHSSRFYHPTGHVFVIVMILLVSESMKGKWQILWLQCRWQDNIKWILDKHVWEYGKQWTGSGYLPVIEFCEYGFDF